MTNLHNPIVLGILTTTLFAIGNLIMRNRAPLWTYAFIFILITGTEYISSQEDEPLIFDEYFQQLGGYPIECGVNPNWVNPYNNPNKDVVDKVYHPKKYQQHDNQQRQEFQKDALFHLKEAQRCWHEAENLCWYLPEKDIKERAKQAFIIAMGSVVPSDPRTKLIAVVVALLGQYGVDCYDTYNFMKEKLAWSEYHFKLYEHYNHLSKI